MSFAPTDAKPAELHDPLLRSLVTLGIILHFVCVGFVYSANVNASRLQQRLAGIFAPYTRLLHLDPGGARLQFTDGSQQSDDHYVEVVPKLAGGDLDETAAMRLPSDGPTFSPDRRRQTMLANDVAAYVERDDLMALFARSIGLSVMQQNNFDHVIVRVKHQGISPLYDDDEDFPEERSTNFVVYEAEVWKDEDGAVLTQKRASGLGAAPTSQGSGS